MSQEQCLIESWLRASFNQPLEGKHINEIKSMLGPELIGQLVLRFMLVELTRTVINDMWLCVPSATEAQIDAYVLGLALDGQVFLHDGD